MEALERELHYTFRNRALLEEALNHSSYANEHRSAGICSNERLEFLGDSILGFVTAEHLFKTYPELPEPWCASRACMRWHSIWIWVRI